ncbi:unnamed protein product, partial [Closterium sp. Naga37s-1]
FSTVSASAYPNPTPSPLFYALFLVPRLALNLSQLEDQSKAEARAGADAGGEGTGGEGGVGAVRAGDEGESGGRERDEDGWECPGVDKEGRHGGPDGQGSGDGDRGGHGEVDGEGDEGRDGEEDRDGDDFSDAAAAAADADARAGAGGPALPCTTMGVDEGVEELQDSDSDADDDDDAIQHAFPLVGSSRYAHAVSAHPWRHSSHPHSLVHGTSPARGSGHAACVAVGRGSVYSRGTPSHLPRATSPHCSAPLSAVALAGSAVDAASENAADAVAAAAAASGVAALAEAARAMVKQEALEAVEAQGTHAVTPLPSPAQPLPDTAARVRMGRDEPEGALRGGATAGAAAAGGGADIAARAAAGERVGREGALDVSSGEAWRGRAPLDGAAANGVSIVDALLRGKRGADEQLLQEKTKLLRRFWMDLQGGQQEGENSHHQHPPQHAQGQREESVPSRAHGGGSGKRVDVDVGVGVGCTGSAPAHPRMGSHGVGRDAAAHDAVHAHSISGAPGSGAVAMPHATPPDPQEVVVQAGEVREERACGPLAAEQGKGARGRASELFGDIQGPRMQPQQASWQQEKDTRYGAAPDGRTRQGGAMQLGSFSLPPASSARALATECPTANNAFFASGSGPQQHRGLPQTDLNIG